VVRDGRPVFQRGGELMEVPVQTSFALLRSAPIGGGLVARVKDGVLTIGPDSMGAVPGPACYGLGGDQATLTDALLCLGYLDPGNFLGGRRALDLDRARAAVKARVADPLSLDVGRAALAVRDEAVAHMAELITATLAEAGLSPSDCALLAYGGNGPMFGAFVAEQLGIGSVHAFNIGPVFSAFGSAISDVVHVYERGLGQSWGEAKAGPLLEAAIKLHEQAVRDLDAEGFDPAKARFEYAVELGDAATGRREAAEFDGVPDEGRLKRLIDAASATGAADGAVAALVSLISRFVVGAHGLEKAATGRGEARSKARPMLFAGGTPSPLPAMLWESMGVGDTLDGPAMINGATLTCAVPPGWTTQVDPYGNARMGRQPSSMG